MAGSWAIAQASRLRNEEPGNSGRSSKSQGGRGGGWRADGVGGCVRAGWPTHRMDGHGPGPYSQRPIASSSARPVRSGDEGNDNSTVLLVEGSNPSFEPRFRLGISRSLSPSASTLRHFECFTNVAHDLTPPSSSKGEMSPLQLVGCGIRLCEASNAWRTAAPMTDGVLFASIFRNGAVAIHTPAVVFDDEWM